MASIDSSFASVDERARVHDEHVGRLGVGGDLMPRLAGEAEHDFAVHQILRTAEERKPIFMCDLSSVIGNRIGYQRWAVASGYRWSAIGWGIGQIAHCRSPWPDRPLPIAIADGR